MKATPNQMKILKSFDDPYKKIVIVTGPAGSGKTNWLCKTAAKCITTKKLDKIVITRPTVGVDENLGFLPGDIDEKMSPWMIPVNEYLSNIMYYDIEVCPIGIMRGRTFKNSFVIADEMQNATIEQMKMLMTRIGENSYIGITGDLKQSDINDNGLEDFIKLFEEYQKKNKLEFLSIQHIKLTEDDIKREDVIKDILNIYYT
jgi:phosphate starvation-inducible PhoH-like protein